MGNFYSRLKAYKKDNRISYKELGAVIGKNEDAFRMALKRETFSQLEVDKLSELFIETKKTEPTIEDLLAERVLKILGDNIKGKDQEILDRLKEVMRGIKNLFELVDELSDKVEKMEEDIKEGNELIRNKKM